MPANIGSQTVSILYHSVANSTIWNLVNLGIIPVGIYAGGWLSVVNGTTARISALRCCVSDGSYQVRVTTAENVNVVVAAATPYIVLRWVYAGTTNDYMEILAVASPAENDLVVGKCTFSGGGALNGFDYDERDNPDTHDLHLKVEPTGDTELRVRIRSGYYQTPTGSVHIVDQKSNAITPPLVNSRIDLIYIDTDGTIRVDSTGTVGVSPVAPSYGNKLVLAEVTVSAGDTTITSSQIKDVRPFITSSVPGIDGTTITTNASGQLKTVNPVYLVQQSQGDQCVASTTWTKVDLGMTCKVSGVTQGDDTFTLTAGRLYRLNYKVRIAAYSNGYHIYGAARFRVVSGDTTWYYGNETDLNVSFMGVYQYSSAGVNDQLMEIPLTFSGIILPSVDTTIQLEVLTRVGNFIGKVVGLSINVSAD